MLVKHVILILHEANAYWQDVHILFHFVAQSVNRVQSGGIFLCRDDDFGRLHGSKRVVDELNVLCLKLVMVGKGERREVR